MQQGSHFIISLNFIYVKTTVVSALKDEPFFSQDEGVVSYWVAFSASQNCLEQKQDDHIRQV